jgi:hypothetical protein
MPIAQIESIPRKAFTARTIERMHELVKKCKTSWPMILLATKITKSCPARAYVCAAQAIYDYVKNNIKYVKDPNGVELVQSPLVTIGQRRAGDCDDAGMCVAALAGAIGMPYAFRTVKADVMRPDEYSHVYCVVFVPRSPSEGWDGGWVAMDTTVPKNMGWQPTGFVAKTWMEPEYE